jgi:hypothetical protein
MAALTENQTTVLAKFKEFIAGGAVTKGGKAVTGVTYYLNLSGELFARGTVKNADLTKPDGTAYTQDTQMTWNVATGRPFGSDAFELVQVVQ